jgi:Predicted integral membrane protein linked to a cation pump
MSVGHHKAGFLFTGWHMAGVMVLFFGTIISVNVLMAYYASTSWSGLVAKNTYIASQEFNGKAAAIREMLATGIKGKLTVNGDEIRYNLSIPEQGPVAADRITAHFRRPVGEHQDFVVELASAGQGDYVASHPVLAGQWIVEIVAERDGKTIMHEANRITVTGASK